MKLSMLTLAGVLALAAAGCGGNAAVDKLTQSCVKQGQLNQQQCSCVSAEVAKTVSPGALNAMMLQADGKMAEGVQALAALTPAEQTGVMVAQLTAMQNCASK